MVSETSVSVLGEDNIPIKYTRNRPDFGEEYWYISDDDSTNYSASISDVPVWVIEGIAKYSGSGIINSPQTWGSGVEVENIYPDDFVKKYSRWEEL